MTGQHTPEFLLYSSDSKYSYVLKDPGNEVNIVFVR